MEDGDATATERRSRAGSVASAVPDTQASAANGTNPGDVGNSFHLSQLVFLVGHVALKHIVHLELVEREWKRRKEEDDHHPHANPHRVIASSSAPGTAVHDALDAAVTQMNDVEVQEEANAKVSQPQVGQDLGKVDRSELLHRFDLQNDVLEPVSGRSSASATPEEPATRVGDGVPRVRGG